MMPSNLPLTVKDCGALTDPANGQVSHTDGTTFGETATYSCDAGYNLVGDRTRTCQVTGVWSGSTPTCQSMLLLELEYLVHAYPDNALLKNICELQKILAIESTVQVTCMYIMYVFPFGSY